MPVQLMTAAALIAMVIACGVALYHWRRAASLYSLLVEGANRFEELRQHGAALEQTLAKSEEKVKLQTETIKRVNTSLDEAREKSSALSGRVEQKELEIRLVTEKLELQKGHLERQLTKVSEQLRLAEEQRLAGESQVVALRIELNQLQRAATEEKAGLTQELTLRDKDWQARLYDLEKAKATAEKQAKAGDPIEMRRLKRKIAQYDRLYSSMKGLREMSDERNRNWEVALRKLSAWILEEKGEGSVPTAIGPLVGAAMHAIGAQLVDDAEITGREGGEGRDQAGSDHGEPNPAAPDELDEERAAQLHAEG